MSDKLVVPWRCEECGREVSGPVEQPRWQRIDGEGEPPRLVALCDECWQREFGRR
jgi:hypothetical protein